MNEPKIHPHLLPNVEDWPIYKLSENRRNFVKELEAHTIQFYMKKQTSVVRDILSKSIYLERIRVKEEPWKVDPPNERQFWRRMQQQLLKHSFDKSDEEASRTHEEMLQQIIHRYSEEIVGTFRIPTFLFARRFLTLFFTRLLNTAAGKSLLGSRYRLYDRMMVKGNVEKVRSLFDKGTVVVVPTHFSNLDSILIGYAMDTFAGFPSFSYGAGLNLYNAGFAAYFMNRLGAYRVDRRKKNLIYLETLKSVSNLSIQHGVNSLFFPGGTRSRSGMIETRLKLGLLGTLPEAQRELFAKGERRKVFVVPVVLGYHFVLEAPFLIEQHLRSMGKERYIKAKDDFYNIWKVLRFAWKFFAESNSITVSFGQPLDVLGNPVDAAGDSYDQYGNRIDVREYFLTNGKVQEDEQREAEYTKILAERIVERYHKDNIVLSSHLVAFAAFNILKRQNARLDLYGVLRLPNDDYVFPDTLLRDVMAQLQQVLFQMQTAGDVRLSEEIHWEVDALLADGIKRLGNYHLQKPMRYNKLGQIVSENFKLLYFYHNRLENYNLHTKISWNKAELEMAPTL
ncbi:MAG TPA: 1-acyl-sn-glycerol-3-phosphate acyltransferase [Saprospiraceae bacterium]|nr:1-acyl-sn-glycerol-3-phosphate acyltransferase [Saprospiraceae bacterium]HMP14326.1 1-acyl-sn-glycerol-3-phosphate acyltransferase [Saprospiraceae bacterium]